MSPWSTRRMGAAVAGVLLMLPLSGCFDSPPQVVSLNPNNGSTNVAGDLPLTIVFDHPVDTRSVLNRFRIDPPLPGCTLASAPAASAATPVAPCSVEWLDGGTKLVVDHYGSPFAPSTRYTMQLGSGFRDSAGVANPLDHQWELTSGTAPRVTITSPAEGARNVPVDGSLVISFTTYMTVPATAAALTISPPVPDTRMVPNSRDHGRFVVLPGRLLRPDQDYTVTVGMSATDEHGIHMDRPGVLHFRTGSLGSRTHVVVLAGRPGERASSLILGSPASPQPGDPIAAATVRSAPRCRRLACGSLTYDQPLEGYSEAALAPDASRLAVVAIDATQPPAPPQLIVEDLPGGTDHVIGLGAGNVSWSPDSTRLAYGADDGIHVVSALTGRNLLLPAGAGLNAPAVWSADSTTLVLPVTGADGVPRIDLADANLRIRYPLPGVLPAPLVRPVLSPQGDSLAVRRLGAPATAGTWLIRLTGGDSTPHRLGTDLTPIGWLDEGTLLALADGGGGSPSLVRIGVAGGDRTTIGGPSVAELGSALPAPSGRQVAYVHAVGGVAQAFLENADGTDPAPLTLFPPGTLQAAGVAFGG